MILYSTSFLLPEPQNDMKSFDIARFKTEYEIFKQKEASAQEVLKMIGWDERYSTHLHPPVFQRELKENCRTCSSDYEGS